MRALLVGVMLIAACGAADPGDGSGGGGAGGVDGPSCRDAANAYHAVVDAKQTFSQDSDCTVIADNCFGPAFCGAYVTVANAAAAHAALDDGRKSCHCDGICMAAPRPGCVDGVCGAKRTP